MANGYKFGVESSKHLAMLCFPLQEVMRDTIRFVDFSIIDSIRGKERQEDLFNEGKSQARFGESPHNYIDPETGGSLAVDIVPYPVPPWNDSRAVSKMETLKSFYKVINTIKIVAHAKDISLEFGFDWKTFNDLGHIEVYGWKFAGKLVSSNVR